MKQVTRVTRIDTHRPCIMELGAGDCVPEGYCITRIATHYRSDDAAKAGTIKTPSADSSPWVGPLLGFLSLLVVALVVTASLVWP